MVRLDVLYTSNLGSSPSGQTHMFESKKLWAISVCEDRCSIWLYGGIGRHEGL